MSSAEKIRIVVVPYNPQWATYFQQIKTTLEEIFTDISYVSIEHVGSTSVPGLCAKPIIDIDIIAAGDQQLQIISEALVSRGGYQNMGEWGVPGRVAFRKKGEEPRRNLYVVLEGCVAARNHLAVREVCRRDADLREAYGKKKMELAEREWTNMDEYTIAKSEILKEVLQKAGLTEDDLKEIARHNES